MTRRRLTDPPSVRHLPRLARGFVLLAVGRGSRDQIKKIEETMKTSKDRILTTHAGSLPRTDKLAELLIERDNGLPVDEGEMRREVERTTDWLVAKQLESGVDIASDGEAARVGFQTYVSLRLSGGGGAACHHAKA